MKNEIPQADALKAYDSEEIIDAELVSASTPTTNPSKPFFERLLSPQSLGWMMSIGGGLLVLGFAIWLWSIGVFANPLTLALSIGAANLSLLGFGIWLLQSTRYKIAGKGITLLCSLAMPLNLWLYDSQGLITISSGKLWVPALLISIIYAAIARITKDANFVYTLVSGMVMTGVLFMAGTSSPFLWGLLPIATMLITVGSICIHADRWFLDNDGPFSRQSFGLAFFRSGHIVLILGLTGLFCSQWLPTFLSDPRTKLWTLGLLVAAIYTYIFSNQAQRKHSLFMILAGLCSCWASFVILQWLQIELTIRMGLLLLNLVFLVANIVRFFLPPHSNATNALQSSLGFSIATLTMLNCAANSMVPAPVLFCDWMCVTQLFAASLVMITITRNWTAEFNAVDNVLITVGMFAFTCGLVSAGYGIGLFGIETLLIAISILSLTIACCGFLDKLSQKTGVLAVGIATSILLISCFLCIAMNAIEFTSFGSIVVTILVAVSCGLVNYNSGSKSGLAISTLAILTSVFQFATLLGILNGFAITATITFIGLLLLAIAKFKPEFQRRVLASNSMNLQDIANSTILIGLSGANLFVLSNLMGSSLIIGHLALLLFHLLALAIAAYCTKELAWRRGFLAMAIVTAILAIIVHFNLSTLTVIQRLEIGSFVLGTLALAAGHFGLMRENSKQDDTVSFNLVMGSFLMTAPLVFGIISDRLAVDAALNVWRYIHEIGGITVGLTLVGLGILCRIRSTTIAGGLLTFIFVFSNILLIDLPDQLQTTSAMMMIGGGLFFGIAVLLSVYREHLLELPEKIKQGSGIFQVLKWR